MIYTVLCDGINIYDSTPSSGLLNPTLELSVNESGSLSFSMLPTHSSYDTIAPFTSNIEVYENEELIFYGRVLDVTKDFLNRKNITCEGALGFLNDTVQEPIIFDKPDDDHPSTQQTTIHQFFAYLINEHNKFVDADRQFTVGTVNVSDATISRELNYEKTIDAIKKYCIDCFGGYLFVRKVEGINYIDWLRDFSAISSQPIQYAVNLTDITQDFKGSDLITSIIPIGDDNLDVSGQDPTTHEYYNQTNPGEPYIDSDAVDTYGRILGQVDFDGITDPNILYMKAVEWMANKQFDALSIDVDSADLSYLDSDYGVYKLGQLVHVLSNPHLIDTNLPIMKMNFKLDSPYKNITIGTPPRQDLSEITVNGGNGFGYSGGSTNKTQVKRISAQVVEEKTPTIVDNEVPNVVQYTKVMQGGVKIGSITIGENTDDIYTNTLHGYGEPSPSLGADGNIYIEGVADYNTVRYVRTNYSQFGLTLSNWQYDLTDKFELTYKNNSNPKAYNDWPHIIGAYNKDDSNLLFMQYNLYIQYGYPRECLNIIYNGQYTGDSAVWFSSPFDYENYYIIGANGGSFYVKKGTDLDHIDTTAMTWSRSTGSGHINGAVKLYCDTPDGLSRPMDQSLYGIKVWNANDELIHNYIPIEDGLLDTVDMTMHVTDKTGHINGPAVENAFTGHVTAIWYKSKGIWYKSTLGYDGEIPELVTLTEEEYQALSPAAKMDLTKAYFVTDAVPTNNYVIPNPPYEPTRELNTIEINGLVYDIPGDIEPNPEEEPTDMLKTLKIEDTTYELAGSGGGSSGYNSNVVHYTDTITTSQYGWISPVLDKDGNPISAEDDLLMDVYVSNSDSSYYGFEIIPMEINSELVYVAKLKNINSGVIVASSVQLTVTISYIKDFYKNGILSEATLSPVIYTETEREVGVWTDGKPLYQRTYHVDSFTSTNWYILDSNLTPDTYSIKNVNTNGYVVDGGGYSNQRYTLIQTNGIWLRITQNTQGFQACIDGSPSSGTTRTDCDITIQYTKTTDVPGSGSYAELGVPSVHYDTTERVIGTWIDGKPVYQKTLYHAGLVSGTLSIAHGISNLSKVLNYSGMVSDQSGIPFPLPRIAYDNNNVGVQSVDITYVNMNNPSAFGTRLNNWYVTIQYTKTTD